MPNCDVYRRKPAALILVLTQLPQRKRCSYNQYVVTKLQNDFLCTAPAPPPAPKKAGCKLPKCFCFLITLLPLEEAPTYSRLGSRLEQPWYTQPQKFESLCDIGWCTPPPHPNEKLDLGSEQHMGQLLGLWLGQWPPNKFILHVSLWTIHLRVNLF